MRNGFFEGELEGSKRYREKMAMAEVRYKSTPNGTSCPNALHVPCFTSSEIQQVVVVCVFSFGFGSPMLVFRFSSGERVV